MYGKTKFSKEIFWKRICKIILPEPGDRASEETFGRKDGKDVERD